MERSVEIGPSSIEAQVVERIADAPLASDPFQHVYLEDVFPAAFYAEMLQHIPAREAYQRIAETGRTHGAYEQRLILHFKTLDSVPPVQRQFWEELARWFLGSELASVLVRKFHDTLSEAIGKDLRRLSYGVEGMLVKDLDGYQIGPHTDVRSRAVSVMFYLPSDNRREAYGTSLYVPRDPSFRSDGSRHLAFDGFRKTSTMPYRPNAMFGFARTNASFHGVEPIQEPDIERDVLLYILRWSE